MIRSFHRLYELNSKKLNKLLWIFLFKLSVITRSIIRRLLPFIIFFFFWNFFQYAIQIKKSLNKDQKIYEQAKKTISELKQNIRSNRYIFDFEQDNSIYRKITEFYDKEAKQILNILYGPSGVGKSKGTINYLNKLRDKNIPYLYLDMSRRKYNSTFYNITLDQTLAKIIAWKSQPRKYSSRLFQQLYAQNFGTNPLLIVIDQIFYSRRQVDSGHPFSVLVENIHKIKFEGLKIVLITKYKSLITQFQVSSKSHKEPFIVKRLGYNQKSDYKIIAQKFDLQDFDKDKVFRYKFGTIGTFQRIAVNCLTQKDKLYIKNCLKNQQAKALSILQFFFNKRDWRKDNSKLLDKLCKNPSVQLTKRQKKLAQNMQYQKILFDNYFASIHILKAYEALSKSGPCKVHEKFLF